MITLNFCWLEIKRFLRDRPYQHFIIAALIAIALQLVVENTHSNKWLFFSLIFTFWLALNYCVRLIAKEKKVISRFRASGFSSVSILISKITIVIIVSLIYSSIFYFTFIYKVINTQTTEHKINELIYSKEKLIKWSKTFGCL